MRNSKGSIGRASFGMYYSFGYSFPVEMGHFFEEQEIFKDDRATWAHGQGILVIANRAAGVRGHNFVLVISQQVLLRCCKEDCRPPEGILPIYRLDTGDRHSL